MNGEMVKAIRLYLGLTQQRFADEAGISRQHLNAVENGKYKVSDNIRMKVLRTIESEDSFFEILDRFTSVS